MPFDAMTAGPAVFLEEILLARAELEAEFAGLTDEQLEEPGMTGEWSGRMTLIHIARWDESATHMVLRDRQGLLPGVDEFEDYEAWNDSWARDRRRHLALGREGALPDGARSDRPHPAAPLPGGVDRRRPRLGARGNSESLSPPRRDDPPLA